MYQLNREHLILVRQTKVTRSLLAAMLCVAGATACVSTLASAAEIGQGFPKNLKNVPIPAPPSMDVQPSPAATMTVVPRPPATTEGETMPVISARPQAAPRPTETSAQRVPQSQVQSISNAGPSSGEEEWVVHIRPGRTQSSSVASQYAEIYESIPYRRTEYLANPSYRHDTTVEIMFGQMRPTTIQRVNYQERVENPRPDYYQPYRMTRTEWIDAIQQNNLRGGLNVLQPLP